MNRWIFLVAALHTGIACNKDVERMPVEGGVEIYALKSFQTVPQKCQIDPNTAVLMEDPVISNDEIIAYSRGNHLFYLTDQGKQDTEIFHTNTAFAVTVNKEVIYYGIHRPWTSSASCDHSITMDISFPSKNLGMNLGYPGGLAGINIDDQRNHLKILTALNAQGKLIF